MTSRRARGALRPRARSALRGSTADTPTWQALLVALVETADVLRRVRVRSRTVAQDVQRDGRVDRRGDVRAHERHRCALRQLLAGERVQLLTCQLFVLLAHRQFPCVMFPVWAASAYAIALSERTFAATAALIGIARFALMSDIA